MPAHSTDGTHPTRWARRRRSSSWRASRRRVQVWWRCGAGPRARWCTAQTRAKHGPFQPSQASRLWTPPAAATPFAAASWPRGARARSCWRPACGCVCCGALRHRVLGSRRAMLLGSRRAMLRVAAVAAGLRRSQLHGACTYTRKQPRGGNALLTARHTFARTAGVPGRAGAAAARAARARRGTRCRATTAR